MSQTAATTLFGPMTPDAVRSAFSYLRAVEADDAEAAAELAAQEPELTQMLLDVAQRVIVPVTVLIRDREEEPNASSFALAELGGVLLDALYFWQGETGPQVTEFLATSIIHFIEQILTQEHETVGAVLHHLQDVALGQALDAHPAPAG
ncbi:hypothetical protein ACH4ND_33155 [Streptomyces sp. NPDC017179]|uniref:hypothetical protein n=1 Tax=Streptomyces sp. NPDC017179 TaxID=3364979 RepID=UPI0037B7A106